MEYEEKAVVALSTDDVTSRSQALSQRPKSTFHHYGQSKSALNLWILLAKQEICIELYYETAS